MSRLSAISAFALSSVILTVMAAPEAPEPSNRSPYLHQTWQFEDGLPQNFVQAICQTSDGYLWVGTQNGLARFDGVHFRVFHPRNTPELKHANVGALRETRDGALWIGTEGGGLVRLKGGTFRNYSVEHGLPSNVIRSLFESSDGTLWIGSRGEQTEFVLTRYRDGQFSVIKELNGCEGHAARGICETPDGTIWVATSRGLASVKGDQVTVEAHAGCRAAMVDRHGDLWVGGDHGLRRMRDRKQYTKKDGLADTIVTSMFEDSAGNFWVGTFGGLTRITDGKFHVEWNAEGVSYDMITTIIEDAEQNIWVGAKDGLNRLTVRVFESFTKSDGLAHNNVMSVVEDEEGTLWIATWGGGLNRFKDGVFTPYGQAHGLSTELVLAILKSRDGSFWVGTDYGGGLFRFENERFKRFGSHLNIPGVTTKVFLEDRHGQIWAGTHLGLLLLHTNSFQLFTTEHGLPAPMIKDLCEDHEGTIWIGTADGLSRLIDGQITRTFTKADGLSSQDISALYEDSEGTLWVGTAGGGLNRYRDGRFTAYTTQQGMFSDDVWSILEDDSGCLWMSSRVGVSRVPKSEFDKLDQEQITKINYRSFGKYDGMVSIECNKVAKPSAWKAQDGRLWFATAKGVAVVDPNSKLTISETPPVVMMEHVVAGRKQIPAADHIDLSAGQRDVEFHYTALSFRAPEKLRFKYRLDGVDRDWVDAEARRVAYYRLRPGTYQFHVTACNNNGIWNPTGVSLKVTVAPHFFETPLFYALCLLGVMLTGISIVQLRVRHIRGREGDLQALVKERTKELEAEIAERQRVQTEMESVHRQLLEVSRKAGMAEVASGVLHNVGNVLNSVNVSATLVIDQIRSSKRSGLARLSQLLSSNSDKLPEFFASDKGRQVPGYVQSLTQNLTEEQESTLRELEGLRKNVDHIKGIVAMQQSLAKAVALVEFVPVNALLEDAVRIHSSALSRRGIRVVQDYQTNTVICVDKHKLLQILVNLVQNAKQACDDSGKPDKEIVVRTVKVDNNTVRLSVQDNGVGIAPENLTRIFSHGFTTRQDGHGYGLHSAALAAKELGGSLTVASDGPGKGATFTVELPVENKPKNEPPRGSGEKSAENTENGNNTASE